MEDYNLVWQREASKIKINVSDHLWDRVEMRMDNSHLEHKLSVLKWIRIVAVVLLCSGFLFWVAQESLRPSARALSIEEVDWQSPYYASKMEQFYIIQNSYERLGGQAQLSPIRDAHLKARFDAVVQVN